MTDAIDDADRPRAGARGVRPVRGQRGPGVAGAARTAGARRPHARQPAARRRRRHRGIIDLGDLTHSTIVVDIAAALASVGATRTGRDLLPRSRCSSTATPRSARSSPRSGPCSATRSCCGTRSRCASRRRDAIAPGERRVICRAGTRARGACCANSAPLTPATWRPRRWPQRTPRPRGLLRAATRVFGSVLAPLTYREPLAPGPRQRRDADRRRRADATSTPTTTCPSSATRTRGSAAAIADQARLLSTNLRYLHPRAIELAERLVATMPPDRASTPCCC